jgi:hypothetical protein
MESAWRESWVDPPDESFAVIRGFLKPVTPWWKKQRVWYAVAAVFAVYAGVKIFVIDRAGAPLSAVVLNEIASAGGLPADNQSTSSHESWTEDAVKGECEEMVEQEARQLEEYGGMIEAGAAQTEEHVTDSVLNQPSLDSQLSGTDGNEEEFSPEDRYLGEIEDAEHIRYSEELYDSAVPESAYEDDETVYRSLVPQTTEAVAERSAAETGSGGGGFAGGTTGYANMNTPASVDCAAAPDEVTGSSGYTARVVLESGDLCKVARSSWPSLFELIDTFYTEYGYSVTDSLVIRVGDDGIVSGPGITDGTVISVPDTTYGNCEVIVLLH